jgi:hypothetical protein
MRLGSVTSLLSSSRRPASIEAEGPLLALLDTAVGKAFSALCRPVQKNLAVLTVAFLRVLGAVRSGHGQLSLAALFRVLPTAGTPHAREKRLHRFLRNPRLDPRSVTDGLARLIFGSRGRGLWPILFDQTKAGATQALFAGVPFQGRALPLFRPSTSVATARARAVVRSAGLHELWRSRADRWSALDRPCAAQ